MRVSLRIALVVAVLVASLFVLRRFGQKPDVKAGPGLGELMSLQQMRHAKLWLAGQAGNWELAAYEIKELNEGFDDVVRLHPTHEGSPVDPKDAVPMMMTGPLEALGQAVAKQSPADFATAFDELTTGCNGCHEATNFGFNQVQRPSANPYPNQVFERVR